MTFILHASNINKHQYEKWYNNYDKQLNIMYSLFNNKISNCTLDMKYISFDDFALFIYKHSSKRLDFV